MCKTKGTGTFTGRSVMFKVVWRKISLWSLFHKYHVFLSILSKTKQIYSIKTCYDGCVNTKEWKTIKDLYVLKIHLRFKCVIRVFT